MQNPVIFEYMRVSVQKIPEKCSDNLGKVDDMLTAEAEPCKKTIPRCDKPYKAYGIKSKHIDKAHYLF